MQVHDAEIGVVIVLRGGPMPQGTEVVADMGVARRLDAGEDASGTRVNVGVQPYPSPYRVPAERRPLQYRPWTVDLAYSGSSGTNP